MFHSLRQQRAPSPSPDTPRAIPSIRLTTATPVAPSSAATAGLAPRRDNSNPRRVVVPKRTLVLHEAPPPLPIPKPRVQPVRDHSSDVQPTPRAGKRSASTNAGKFKVFVDAPEERAMTPQLVPKKKTRAALDSIKWALGDRTNGPKVDAPKPEKQKIREPRASTDSDREKSDKEKWKWTLGRSRKNTNEKLGRNSPMPDSQPSSVRLQGLPFSSISSGQTLVRAASPVPPVSRGSTPVPEMMDEQTKNGSIAVRAMRSVRSMARIGGWARSESPVETMSKRLAKTSTKAKEAPGIGSGESWLAGPHNSPGSPSISAILPSTVRPPAERRSSSEKPLPPIRFGSIMPGRKSRLSTSTTSSGESVLPRESTSTRGPSMESKRTSVDSKRTSTSSRLSSGVGSVMSSSFWMPSSSIPESEADNSTPSTKRTSKSTEGLKRSALMNIFDISTDSASTETPSSKHVKSADSFADLSTYSASLASQSDPFAAGEVDSFLPAASPQGSPSRQRQESTSSEPIPRPRPLSDQGSRKEITSLFGEPESPGRSGLNVVNHATSELSDLINRLDLIATPSASPARNWLATPSRSPDGMPDFAIATVERALRQRYPDVPTSVQSKGNATFTAADSSFGSTSDSTPQNTMTVRGISNMPLTGSVADLRRGAGAGAGPFVSGSIRAESSITSLRPYRAVNKTSTTSRLPAIHFSPSSDPESRRAAAAPYTTPSQSQRRSAATRRPRASVQPREQSSEESLRSKLELDALGSEPRRRQRREIMSFATTTSGDFSSASESEYFSSGRDDPTSESADDEQSDIPDELRDIIDHHLSDSGSDGSHRSFRDSLASSLNQSALSSRPLSGLSDQSFEQHPPSSSSRPQPFSMTVTAPSVGSHDSDPEFIVNSEDDTGKKSFDFTGEINRLNGPGGARQSFMEQMEAIFIPPSNEELRSPSVADSGSPTAWELSNAGSNSTLRKPSPGEFDTQFSFGTPSSGEPTGTVRARVTIPKHTRSDTQSSVLSEHELSLLKDLDASMYALATLNLGLGHPSSQTTLTGRDVEKVTLDVPAVAPVVGDISLARDIDSSAYKIATIDLSLIHPSGTSAISNEDSGFQDMSVSDSAIEASRGRTLSIESDTNSKRRARSQGENVSAIGHSRQESQQSVSSFGSILYGGVSDPFGYKYGEESSELPSVAESSKLSVQPGHGHSDSIASIPSISSYGQILKGGSYNPFGYAASMRTTHTRDASFDYDYSRSGFAEDSLGPNSQGSVRRHRAGKSTDSDRSMFYFRSKEPPPPLPLPPLPEGIRAHHRDESSASIAPPVSLHNNSYRRHQRNQASNDSGSSIAHAYSNFGANGGRATWARHQSDASVDSGISDFSAPVVERPGLGDKMFSYRGGAPLTSIMASPSASEANFSELDHFGKSDIASDALSAKRSSGDSDSFLKPNATTSDVSVFGGEDERSTSAGGLLFNSNVGNRRRPLSVFSTISASTDAREDDTMISMLGGGHISRKAMENASGSPSFKVRPRKKRPAFQVKLDRPISTLSSIGDDDSFTAKPKPSTTFGRSRMALATQGLLERNSLEDSALLAEGSDSSVAVAPAKTKPIAPRLTRNIFAESLTERPPTAPLQTRVGPSNEAPKRSASIIVTTAPDTPPTSDAESMYSQSNIDVTRLSVASADFSRPGSANSARIRARGYGHRRRSGEPSTVDVGTILEEVPGLVHHSFSSDGSSVSSMASTVPSTRFDLLNCTETHVDIVDGDDDTQDELMQRYMTLRKQALEVVQQSKQEWQDTDFSRFALATFVPPKDAKSLKAFYEHSIKTYTPLVSELVIRRPRTNSRPTPYGYTTSTRVTPKKTPGRRVIPKPHARTESVEHAMSCISPPMLGALPPNSPFVIDRSFSGFGLPALPLQPAAVISGSRSEFKAPTNMARPRVNSKVRRNALGWSKQQQRTNGTITEEGKPELPAPFASATARGKENAEGVGMLNTSNTSLRISRPRPKSRPQSMLGSGTVRAR